MSVIKCGTSHQAAKRYLVSASNPARAGARLGKPLYRVPFAPKGPGDGRIEHIKRLCRHRPKNTVAVNWLAYPLQNPGAKKKWQAAVVVYGSEGTGKSITFDEVMGRIYGEYKVTIGQAQLEQLYRMAE